MPTTDVEKMTLSVRAVIGLLSAVCAGLLWGINEQNALKNKLDSNASKMEMMASQIGELKQDVKGLGKIGEIEAKLATLQTRGSDAVQDVARQVSGFAQAVEAFRSNGSPGEEKRMTEIEKRLAVLEKKFDVREALEDKRSKP